MTGNADAKSIGIFRRTGFDGVLAKPFTEVRVACCVTKIHVHLASQHDVGVLMDTLRSLPSDGERPFVSVMHERVEVSPAGK